MTTMNGKVALTPEGDSTTPHPSPLPVRGEGEPDGVRFREPSLARVVWDAWKAYSHRAGGYQTTLLLSAAYFLVLGPSALLTRLSGGRLLDLDPRPRSTYWIERKPLENTLAALERQF